MYKIGEFSKLTSLTIQALRYYDSEGILTPSYRDQRSGYRFYNAADFERVELIQLLKAFEFSIAELKEVLAAVDAGEDVNDFFEEKKEQLGAEITKKREVIGRIEKRLVLRKQAARRNEYRIVNGQLPAMLIASVSYRGRYDEVGVHIGKLFKAVKSKAAGPVFICLHDDSYQELAAIEICVPISGEINDRHVATRMLAGGAAISTIHYGRYDTLQYAYKALFEYSFAHNLLAVTPSREVYHRGPGLFFKGNPDKYQTEVIIMVEEGGNTHEQF